MEYRLKPPTGAPPAPVSPQKLLKDPTVDNDHVMNPAEAAAADDEPAVPTPFELGTDIHVKITQTADVGE